METKKDTMRILNNFFADCMRFWMHENKSIAEALPLALTEVAEVTHNPFDPYGKQLDVEGKQEFIKRIKKDLKELNL